MTTRHTFYSAAILALAGLFSGPAVERAWSQELTPRNELIPKPSEGQSAVPPASETLARNRAPALAKSLATSLWPAEAAERSNPLWAIPRTSLAATRERPIFSPSRRPPPVQASQTPQPEQAGRVNEPNQPLLALLGTVLADAESIAIFHDEKSNAVIRLRTGESRSGWTLTAVQPREATLQHNGKAATVSIPSPAD